MRTAFVTPHRCKKWALFLLVFVMLGVFDSVRETAIASFSSEDERKLGKEFYEKIVKANLLSQNERANTFLTRLGERILATTDKAPFDFKFSIIRSTAVNAFATPGGYVYINQGLITLVENEAQLAGVLAHEIAHVNGRHIAEIIDRSQKIGISALAAVLAGAFLGGGGEATAAVAGFTMATATALSLKYSREQEESADRMGMTYLVHAGYNGGAMLDFLKIMRRYEYYSNNIPSYFLTHPGTDERSRYIDALLQTTYTRGGATEIIGHLGRIQTILLLSKQTSDSANLQHFQKLSADNSGDVDALYGLAVTQDKLGMADESLETFRKALLLAPNDSEILRDLGSALFKLRRFADASTYLNRARKLDENDLDTILYLGRTYEALGEMHNALNLYKRIEQKHPEDPDLWYSIAMAYGKTNQMADSHYYFGRYFKKKGKADSALFHFRAALQLYPKDSARSRDIAKEMESLKN